MGHRDPGGEHQEDPGEEQQQGGGGEQGRAWVQPPAGQDGLLRKPLRALTLESTVSEAIE